MKKETKRKILRGCIAAGCIALLFLSIFLPLYFTGALSKIKSAEDLQTLIQSGGAWSYLIFFALQFLQVTFLPIPAAVTTVAGMLAFENFWIVAGISISAVLLASILAFYLGRKLGKKVVVWVAGEEDYIKWAEKLGRGKYVFFLMMLMPVFPDDILCMIAGTTNMSWKFFIITNVITRPIGTLCTCFLSSGIIPFAGWWIALWIVLVIVCIVIFILCYKFQPQIENFIYKLSHKMQAQKNDSQNANNNDNQDERNIDKPIK